MCFILSVYAINVTLFYTLISIIFFPSTYTQHINSVLCPHYINSIKAKLLALSYHFEG